jgi:hypothetical protein
MIKKDITCGDKGYISKSLFAQLYDEGVKLVSGIKKNMKNCLMNMHEKMILRKRSLIETVFSYLKHTMQLEHTRHRSPLNALIHMPNPLFRLLRLLADTGLEGVEPGVNASNSA